MGTMKRKWRFDFLILIIAVLFIRHPVQGKDAPSVDPFAGPINLHEDTVDETLLQTISCTPAKRDTECMCNAEPTDLTVSPFSVWKVAGETDFSLYFVGESNTPHNLDFQQQNTYTVTISCTDNEGSDAASIAAEIDIIQNASPSFTDTSPHQVSLDASSPYTEGDWTYTVAVTDSESDSLQFSITTAPAVNYFSIGETDGELTNTIDLRAATEDFITITVSVTDGHSVVNNFQVEVTITNMNAAPRITNLPDTVYINEDASGGDTIKELTITDADSRSLTTECVVTPVEEQHKFTYDSSTTTIKLSDLGAGVTNLDYEEITTYTIVCTTSDGYLETSGTLTVVVWNVNEPPEFDEVTYSCSLDEGAAASSSCSLNAVITDPEGHDFSVTFVTDTNSPNFFYHKPTSTISLAVDYDVDSPASMDDSVTLKLLATDTFGATATVPVTVTISDVNDNACDFTTTSSFAIDETTTIGALGTITATDNDKTSPNNDVTFSVVSPDPASASNYLDVHADGSIYYTDLIPTSEHGKSFRLTIKCEDGGSPAISKQGAVVLSYTVTSATTTTTTTTTTTAASAAASSSSSDDKIFDKPAFVAVLAIAAVILVGMLIGGGYFMVKRCNKSSSTRPISQQPQDNYFNYFG